MWIFCLLMSHSFEIKQRMQIKSNFLNFKLRGSLRCKSNVSAICMFAEPLDLVDFKSTAQTFLFFFLFFPIFPFSLLSLPSVPSNCTTYVQNQVICVGKGAVFNFNSIFLRCETFSLSHGRIRLKGRIKQLKFHTYLLLNPTRCLEQIKLTFLQLFLWSYFSPKNGKPHSALSQSQSLSCFNLDPLLPVDARFHVRFSFQEINNESNCNF